MLSRVFLLTCLSSLVVQSPIFSQPVAKTNGTCDNGCLRADAFTQVAKAAKPAVVFIKIEGGSQEMEDFSPPQGYQNPFDDDFFNRFFGNPGRPPRPSPQQSQGSGFLVSGDGYIVTNNHVVKGADKITVVLYDGTEYTASMIGADSHTDLAIIKIEGNDLPFLTWGDSDALEDGEWVVAIGAPFQLRSSITKGIVSARERNDLKITNNEDYIQTDASINPGNSGGPLLNLTSEVVGVNTAILSRSGGSIGISFSISSNLAKNIMAQIMETGTVSRGYLGVSLQPVDKDIADAFNLDKAEGALIADVLKDSPADKAGIKQGDIILEYNKKPVKNISGFRNDISLMKPGSTINLKINRKGQIMMLTATLGTSADNNLTLGLEVQNLTPDLARQMGINPNDEGVVITKVKPGSPSAQAGMHPGYMILSVDHKPVNNVNDFNMALSDSMNKKRVLILARSGKVTRFFSIKVD